MDSISRHEQLLRVFHLIDILFGARQPLSVAELKERLVDRGVIDTMSDKNIRRDVTFLEKFGYALKRSRKRTPRGTACDAWSIEPGRGATELPAGGLAARHDSSASRSRKTDRSARRSRPTRSVAHAK